MYRNHNGPHLRQVCKDHKNDWIGHVRRDGAPRTTKRLPRGARREGDGSIRIDFLVLNAGITCPDDNTDGLEAQFQTNHLGHFVPTNEVPC